MFKFIYSLPQPVRHRVPSHFNWSLPLDSSTPLFRQPRCLTTIQLPFLNFQITQVEYFWRSSPYKQRVHRHCLSEHLACAAYSVLKLTTATNSQWYLRGLYSDNTTAVYLLKSRLQVYRNRYCITVICLYLYTARMVGVRIHCWWQRDQPVRMHSLSTFKVRDVCWIVTYEWASVTS